MQKLAEVCIRRPVFAAMIVLSLVVVGAASYARLGVDRFPAVDIPSVSVRTELAGASAEEVETQVTREIEQVVNTVQGIRELRSISGPGQSIVILDFDLRRNIDVAAQDVREKVATAIKNLPRDAKPPIISKFDNDQAPVLTVAVAGNLPLRELTELADKVVKVQLERSFGVGEVRLVGGLNRAINVWVEADRLAAYQLPITAVRDALVRQNADMPGGNVTAGLRESSLRTLGRVADPRAFEDVVIATVNGAPIRVRDVGRAEDGTAEQRSVARLNGVPSVILEVRRQSGENTVAVIEAAKQSLARLAPQMPGGVRLEVIRDQSRYIYAALHEISVHLVLGSILASLVVLAFMRSWQSTIIAAVAIPASVVSAFGMMWALGFTLNSVTMLALVLMVGIVIDDAIVVLENVFRFIEEKRMNAFEAARAATADIGLAVMATTFSLVVIFLPVSFMSSVSGPLPLPVRRDGGGVGAREPARVVHADAHDERAHDPRGRRVRGPWARPRGGRLAPRVLRVARPRLHVDAPPVHALSLGGDRDLPRRDRVHVADLRLGEAGVHADRRRRERVRGDHQRPGGHLDARDGRGGPGHRHRGGLGARRADRPHHRGRRLPRRASARGTSTCAPRPTRSARSASDGSGAGSSTAIPWPRSAATMPSAT